MSIGIETINNMMCKILAKDTTIPCSYKKYFTTSEDNQTEIKVKLFQGERDNINDNFYLGSFVMDNLDPEPQGKIVVSINISVSTDGLITIEGKVKNTEKFNKKIIINRYDTKLNENQILNNIKNYELSDHVFNSIIQKYYSLITMLNRLQYNLLDNIITNTEPNVEYMKMVQDIFNAFWTDLKSIHKMMSQSDKINPNITQLTKIISNIESKVILEYEEKNIDLTDDKLIINRLDILNKYIEKNLQHLVQTYQIKTDGIDNTIIETKYDTLENDIKLKQINSISNSTEILDSSEKELLYQVENQIQNAKSSYTDNNHNIKQTKTNITYLKEIKDLTTILVENIDTFDMNDSNKILILEILDKYDTYVLLIIKKDHNFNAEYHLNKLQQLCLNISNINDDELMENLYTKLEEIKLNSEDESIKQFENILDQLN